MFVDSIVIIAVIVAFLKGYRRGFVISLFTMLSLIIGLAAAIKLSTVAAPYLAENFPIPPKYLPIVSFAAVYLVAIIIIRALAKLIHKSLEMVQLGLINRLAGAALHVLVYLAVVSIAFYYLEKMGTLSNQITNQSTTHAIIAPWGPLVIDTIAHLIPWFKGMFGEVGDFFEQISPDTPVT